MLKAKDLTIVFDGLHAVKDLSLEVPQGIIFGIIGPNGAGKTTVFNMISGVLKPTRGEITFNGQNIVGLQPWQICKLGIARTYQNLNIFGQMTVKENILVGRHLMQKQGFFDALLHTKQYKRSEKEAREKAEELMDFLGILEDADQQARNLSYGQQRRLEIARALSTEPKLLLLDEPAAGMNTQEKLALQEVIRKICCRGVTILLIEHDMKLVMNTTEHICVINYGQKIAEGTPNVVRKNPDVITAYLGGGRYADTSGG
jgi:branched-chain amino acid transport system ATP-binding protein